MNWARLLAVSVFLVPFFSVFSVPQSALSKAEGW